MYTSNPFSGKGKRAQFARIAYKRLMSREWVMHADVMADYNSLKPAKELTRDVSKCDYDGELRKAFPMVCEKIRKKVGDDAIVEEGNNRIKRFKYVGEDPDPLANLLYTILAKSVGEYQQFCRDSAGFFPISWLEYFFKDCKDLLNIKKKRKDGEQVLSASLDRMLTNIELLPLLYKAVTQKEVLSIEYKPYNEDEQMLSFHPHFLKEFNGRWYIFGHADGCEPQFGYNLALDRIVGEPKEKKGVKYLSAPSGFYTEYFKNIVGVSHSKNDIVQVIKIRVRNKYMFMLTETKPIHSSQLTVTPYGQHKDGEYGEFSLAVEVNKEFLGRILQMGSGLEIVSPQEVRDRIKRDIEKMADLYK